jgi:parallel beta-helix repeat protein
VDRIVVYRNGLRSINLLGETQMNKKLLPIFVLFSALLGVIMIFGILGLPRISVIAAEQHSETYENSAPAGILAEPATIITVTSGTDPDDSKSKTCYTGSSATTPCTLRRAIIESRISPKPVLIKFEIPENSSEGYDSQLDFWKIELYPTTDIISVFRVYLNGDVTIDGTTQPGGRNSGPKIILLGPGTGNRDGIKIGETQFQDNNVIRGLGFQNFKTHMYINSGNNLIEDNWFGLSDDGTDVYLRDNNPEDGSGNAGLSLQASANENVIQNNVFLGFDGVAAAIRGDSNSFSMNYVGTESDGTVPGKETDPDLICTKVDWLGGGGISVDGDNHIIEENIFAGLRQDIFSITTPPSAIQAGGDGHTISNNQIGVDSADSQVGVCGRGIYLISDPENNQLTDNTIVYPGLSGISLNGALYDANTLRRNTIKARSGWTEIEGNAKPEDAIQLGAGLPDAFEFFIPAKITEIDGTTVKGGSGENSPCAGCRIELFLDDTDIITEALQSLGVVSAGSDGKWSATIPSKLSSSQGIRTTSTSMKYNTIPNMSTGTTTGLSILYTESGSPIGGNKLFMPLVINKD